MQQGYFDQCNDIISNLEDKLSKIQLIVDDLSMFAFGNTQIKAAGVSDAKQPTGTPVPSSKLQNRMIDAGEHADLIIDELTRLSLFLLGKQEEDWKDDLAFTDSAEAHASPVKQAKPETLEAVEVARKIVSAQDCWRDRDDKAFTKGEACYVIDITRNDPVLPQAWDDNELFKELLARCLVFKAKDKEAAIAHAKALISFSEFKTID